MQLNCRVLNFNNLTSIPSQVGQLRALRVLSAFTNKLTALPSQLGQLTALTELYVQLAGVNVAYVLADSLLGKNELTALPTQIGRLQSLITM